MTVWITNSLLLLEFIADRAIAPPLIYFVALGVLYVVSDCLRGLLK